MPHSLLHIPHAAPTPLRCTTCNISCPKATLHDPHTALHASLNTPHVSLLFITRPPPPLLHLPPPHPHLPQPSPLTPLPLLHPLQGVQAQERHLFLFSDLLLVAKSRSGGNFKLKEKVRVSEMWLSSCLEDVAEVTKSHDTSFVMGWPTTNVVATFRLVHIILFTKFG